MTVAVTAITGVKDVIWSAQDVKLRTVTFDSSYVQTGEPVNASDFSLHRFDSLEPLGMAMVAAGTTAFAVTAQISLDRKSALLFVHGQEPASVVTTTIAFADADAAEDLSTFSVVMRAIGY